MCEVNTFIGCVVILGDIKVKDKVIIDIIARNTIKNGYYLSNKDVLLCYAYQ